ncbi:MAG: polyprenyl synthetase family protein [Planctomycetes bacterium]|nr:polyprenyl synthetase family protein [Planctomycetota bacterium]
MSFETQLRTKTELVNNTLLQLLTKQSSIDNSLDAVLNYTLTAGGKRLRSALVLFCCELASGAINDDAKIAAAAIEMVHTYSLVHDDLPAMDNDDLRRGVATCHKKFDEPTAILTGDALLTLAFEILAGEISEPAIAVKLIKQLARAAGPSGMIAGQMADLKAEKTKGSIELLEYIHINKTAKMFQCAAALGAICGGAKEKEIELLSEYGLKIGLGFQIADDILDISSSSEQLGKTAGKDVKSAKCTYPAVVGMEKSKKLAQGLADEAVVVLEPFGSKADVLRQLVMALLKRTK